MNYLSIGYLKSLLTNSEIALQETKKYFIFPEFFKIFIKERVFDRSSSSFYQKNSSGLSLKIISEQLTKSLISY